MKFITYDAWKYANDSFRRMFLLKIQQELKMKPTEEMRRFYQSEISESEPRTTLSAKGIAIAVAVLAIISLIIFLIPCVSITWKVAIPTIGTLGTFFLALINGCFYDLKISFSKPALFAPEQFEDCFKEMMSKCLKRKNWFQKKWSAIKDYVEVGEVSVVGLEKLVIVIDNIDRCPSDMAYQMLTDIKTFLSDLDYNLVFIVPVDDEALKKHLFRRWNKGNEEDFQIGKKRSS
jgi:KAP family P-loop domain.